MEGESPTLICVNKNYCRSTAKPNKHDHIVIALFFTAGRTSLKDYLISCDIRQRVFSRKDFPEVSTIHDHFVGKLFLWCLWRKMKFEGTITITSFLMLSKFKRNSYLLFPSNSSESYRFSDYRVSDLPHSKLTNNNIIVSYWFIQMWVKKLHNLSWSYKAI